MALENESKYPAHRALALELGHDATPDAMRGCVENSVTCRGKGFASAYELLQLIVTDLDAPGIAPGLRKRSKGA
jgi:hypothetical protein